MSVLVKNIESGAGLPGFEVQLCLFLIGIYLCLRFLICEVGMLMTVTLISQDS